MTLSEIFVQLPPGVATHLEECLEQATIPDNPTREQVMEVAHAIAVELRYSVVDVAFEGNQRTLALLEQLPQAIVDQLF